MPASNTRKKKAEEGASPELFAGKYRLVRLLGKGAMGEVWLADEEGPRNFRRRVAVKRLSARSDIGEYARDSLFAEAQVIARLDHPNVVRLIELGTVDGSAYLVLDYVDGPAVDRLLKKVGPFSPRVVAYIGREVARALEAVHSLCDDDGASYAVVHRDVSPSNILIARDGRIRLTDFGVARISGFGDQKTETGVFKGKLAYMPPEQARGEPFDGRADVFSLGLTLLEALLARRVRKAETQSQLIMSVASSPVQRVCELLPELPAELAAALDAATEFDAEKRTPDAATLALHLDRALLAMGPGAEQQARGELKECVETFTSLAGPTSVPSARASSQGVAPLSRPPGEASQSVPPADSKRSVPPADSRRSVPPADSRRSVPPADSGRSVPPADSKRSVPPADSKRSVPPSGERRSGPSSSAGRVGSAPLITASSPGGEPPASRRGERLQSTMPPPRRSSPGAADTTPRVPVTIAAAATPQVELSSSRRAQVEEVDALGEDAGPRLSEPPELLWENERRRRRILFMGLGAIASLVVVRLVIAVVVSTPKEAASGEKAAASAPAPVAAESEPMATEVRASSAPPPPPPAPLPPPAPSDARGPRHVVKPSKSAPVPPAGARERSEPAQAGDAKTNALQVVVLPWADVAIDGRAVGTTPIPAIVVPLGTHSVVLRNAELGVSRTMSVVVTAGSPTLLRVDLRRTK